MVEVVVVVVVRRVRGRLDRVDDGRQRDLPRVLRVLLTHMHSSGSFIPTAIGGQRERERERESRARRTMCDLEYMSIPLCSTNHLLRQFLRLPCFIK